MENAPEAAAQTTEATLNTNSNPVEAAPAVEQPAADLHGFTDDQLAEMAKFIDANGGYDKAFSTFKSRISNPAPVEPAQPAQQPVQQPVQQPQQVEQPAYQTPQGYVTPQEFMAQTYYNQLANEEAYAPIADKIRSGEMFQEMGKFGIRPMDERGNINDTQVRQFFDLYSKTVPATPAATPDAAAAPTVDYIPTENGITSFDQAARIIAQSNELKARGIAVHPELNAAEEFIKNSLGGKK